MGKSQGDCGSRDCDRSCWVVVSRIGVQAERPSLVLSFFSFGVSPDRWCAL